MLITSAAALAFPPSPAWPYTIRCALVESFTVHARALHHFLWPQGRLEDRDVLAQDYFTAGTWTRPAHPPLLEDLRDQVATFIVHISYDRPNPGGEKQWPVVAMALEFDDLMAKFQKDVERINPSLLDDKEWRRNPQVEARKHAAAILRGDRLPPGGIRVDAAASSVATMMSSPHEDEPK
jgi:hypothetical protein